MPFASSVAAALTVQMCFMADAPPSPFDAFCLTSVSEKDLAGSVTGPNQDADRKTRLSEAMARDQQRLVAGLAGLQTGMLLSDMEMEALTEANHPFDPDKAPKITSLADAMQLQTSLPALIVQESSVPSHSSATVTADIRMGSINMGGMGI